MQDPLFAFLCIHASLIQSNVAGTAQSMLYTEYCQQLASNNTSYIGVASAVPFPRIRPSKGEQKHCVSGSGQQNTKAQLVGASSIRLAHVFFNYSVF